MHIYTLPFANLGFINGYEFPRFYDIQLSIWPVLFIDAI